MSQLGNVQREFDELLNGAETAGEAMRMCDLLCSVLCYMECAHGAQDILQYERSLFTDGTHQAYALAYFLTDEVADNGPDRKLYMPNSTLCLKPHSREEKP